MVYLRATKKVLKFLPLTSGEPADSDTALGDWYVNRVVIGKSPLLLMVSSKSLLPIVVPARNVKTLGKRLPQIVGDRLERLEVDRAIIEAEINVMDSVQVGSTTSRSVLGTMVDFAKSMPFYIARVGLEEPGLQYAEDRLAHTPCRCRQSAGAVIWPDRTAVELLTEKWQ